MRLPGAFFEQLDYGQVGSAHPSDRFESRDSATRCNTALLKLTNRIICFIPQSHFLGEDRGQETRRPEKGQLSGDNERMCRRRRRRRFVDFDAAPV